MIPSDPIFYIIGLTAVFIIAFGKGAFGGGLAMLGVPLLSIVMHPMDAAIVVAPIAVLTDVFAIGNTRLSTASKPDVIWLVPPILIGLVLGYVFFVMIDPEIVSVGIGIVTFVFAADWFIRGRRKQATGERPLSPVLATISGATFGFTSFIAHSGAPILSAYLLHRGLNKTLYVGTSVVIYGLVNILKAFPYLWIALARPQLILEILLLALAVPVGIWFGTYFHDRVDQQRLIFWCYVICLAASAKLLFDTSRVFMF